MSAVGKKLHRANDGKLLFHCPGCECLHGVHVDREEHPKWAWNGNGDRPTFTPSIHVFLPAVTWADDGTTDPEETLCHSFVTDGRIQFLGDCSHALANQTVELPDWED